MSNSSDLFVDQEVSFQPLAARMRPQKLSEYIGQTHILGATRGLRQILARKQVHSMILWGPPGVGKTTLASLLANELDCHFITLSAVLSGVQDIRKAVEEAKFQKQQYQRKSILFIDEVHRFNKSQQDAFLPYVEDGTVTFIGATTENPSFEVNSALLSRCRVYMLENLTLPQLTEVVNRALDDCDHGLGARQLRFAPDAMHILVETADGDARKALNLLEIVADLVEDGEAINVTDMKRVVAHSVRRFDKGGDLFYEQISALHKSVRGSAPDAALYWMMRMLDGGCDPLYIARRLARMASEDIGNADPRALTIAKDAWDVFMRLGSPEGELTLAQAVIYLACAPKSNAVYTAFKKARSHISEQPSFDVPVHLRNAPTKLMKELGYGHEYRYAHDEPNGYAAGENYFPDELADTRYYFPVARGLEEKIVKKLRFLDELDHEYHQK